MVRDDFILEAFLKSLRKKITGFGKEPDDVQRHLAQLIWDSTLYKRQHNKLPDHMAITYQELAKKFGRSKFPEINDRLGLFEITSNWSQKDKLTKGYKLSGKTQNILSTFLKTQIRSLDKLIGGDGRYVKSLPKAVASKDMDGITTSRWNHLKFKSKVPVDIPLLKKLKSLLKKYKKNMEEGHWNGDLFFQKDEAGLLDNCNYCINVIEQVIRLAHTETAEVGYVIHRYIESSAGRLYAKNINLQTVPRAVKQAALHELWEYDFENCHYAIFHQLATRAGIELPTIERYLEHKADVRKLISDEVQISPGNTKTCLLAIMYGARESNWHKNAIPSTLNDDAAVRRLYKHPDFSGLMKDIKRGRKAILDHWEMKGRTTYMNHMDKRIKQSEPPEKILAHLIQGVEAKMLSIVFHLYPEKILLLQHDGFATLEQLDRDLIITKIKEETGFDMELSEDRIHINKEIIF